MTKGVWRSRKPVRAERAGASKSLGGQRPGEGCVEWGGADESNADFGNELRLGTATRCLAIIRSARRAGTKHFLPDGHRQEIAPD